MKKQDNESLIQELTKRLDWYIMEASDEEFDADEVQTLMKLLDNLKTEEDNIEDELPVEEALDDFWKHCEEREEEERLLLGTEEEKDKSEPVAEKEEDKPRTGKLHKVLWYFHRRRFVVVTVALLVVMILGGSWQVVANAEKHGGFFWWMDKNEEGTTMITAPEGVEDDSDNYKIELYYDIENVPEEYREYVKSYMEHPEWLGDFTKEDLEKLLNSGTKIWIYYLDNNFVCSMMTIPSSEKNMIKFELDLDYKKVIDYGPMFVNPKYVGNKLQYQMLNELDKYSIDKNYNFVVATIHPDNIYSINNFIKDNFKQTSTKEFKRGLRNIYVKKLINK